MNIVFLAPFAFSPKATVSARMLPIATALVRRGHRVTILIPPYDNPADSGQVWEHAGVRLENVSSVAHGSTRGAGYVALAKALASRAHAIKPDALHVFKPIGVGALAFWLLRRSELAKQPTALDNDDWEGHGGWLDVNPYPLAHKLVMAWQERWCLQHAPIVTCASHVLVDRTRLYRAAARRAVDDKTILLSPNGPDEALRAQVTAAQARRDSLRAQFGWQQPIAIYAGTVPLNHDLDMMVRALTTTHLSGLVGPVTQRLPKVRWVIIATGSGVESLKRAISQAGIGESVEWHGFMPHTQLVERLVAADLAVYPYRDTNINRAKCSGKVMDYMACGLPMVVSDVGMNRDYLEHERSGLLTPPGDAAAFAQGLQRLLADQAFATRLGRAAQQRIWDVFGWDQRMARFEAIYHRP